MLFVNRKIHFIESSQFSVVAILKKITPMETLILTHNCLKYLEGNLAQEKFEGFFPLTYAISSCGKCLNCYISVFQRVDIFQIVNILN